MPIFMLFLIVKYFIFTDDEFAINLKINIELVPSCLFTWILSWKSIQIIFFLLFVLKCQLEKGFVINYKPTFKKAIAVERTRKKFKKCKLNLNFSVKCWESNLYISLSKLKCLKDMNKVCTDRNHTCLLSDEISSKDKPLKSLNKSKLIHLGLR